MLLLVTGHRWGECGAHLWTNLVVHFSRSLQMTDLRVQIGKLRFIGSKLHLCSWMLNFASSSASPLLSASALLCRPEKRHR